MISDCFQRFEQGENIELCGISFSQQGILLNKKFPAASWNDFDIRTYQGRYSFYSKTQPENSRLVEYAAHWNVDVAYHVLKAIIQKN